MKYDVQIHRQEGFEIEADTEQEAIDIAFDNAGLSDFDARPDKRILDYYAEGVTRVDVVLIRQ